MAGKWYKMMRWKKLGVALSNVPSVTPRIR